MTTLQSGTLDEIVVESLAIADIDSAAIFRIGASGSLELVAAAGIEGAPLDGLVAAVQNPAHPVARAVLDPGPTFDVRPVNPGGPALRSHLPLRMGAADGETFGVLALAHESPLGDAERAQVTELAARAASLMAAG